MVDLSPVIKVIVGLSGKPIKDQLDRNEMVQSALRKMGFEPEHPENKFSVVYIHTLVKYGVGKPEALLQLFRVKEVSQAFRQAFEQENPSIVAETVEEIRKYTSKVEEMLKQTKNSDIDSNIDIDKHLLSIILQESNINIEKELNHFTTIFIEVANSTRGPSDVIRDQEIRKLRESLSSILSVQEWNYIILFKSEKNLVTFEFEPSSDYLGVDRDDDEQQEIRLKQKFRLLYQLPFTGYALLIEGTDSGWDFIRYYNYKNTIADEEIRYIQERIAPVKKNSLNSFSAPPDGWYSEKKANALGLHKMVLLLSQNEFPETIKNMILQETEKLSALALKSLVEYYKENTATIKLILTEYYITQ
ncbi:MAG: hypothetical protein IM466_10820 [Microcystis sp. M04BS1]|nr:hypothetical protein [Microcystis sp. M04BS1]